MRFAWPAALFLLLSGLLPASAQSGPALNTLTPEEEKSGWTLLFNGKDLSQWSESTEKQTGSKAWVIEDGVLILKYPRQGHSLYSIKSYSDFEWEMDWRVAPRANGGVKYLCVGGKLEPDFENEMHGRLLKYAGWAVALVVIGLIALGHTGPFRRAPLRYPMVALSAVSLVVVAWSSVQLYSTYRRILTYPPGYEYQMIDDDHYTSPLKPYQLTASLYDLIPSRVRPNPPGEWNHARILIRGRHGEHWLNGVKAVEFEIGSPELRKAIAESKFATVPGFGEEKPGLLQLQNHGGHIEFRNMKIRELQP